MVAIGIITVAFPAAEGGHGMFAVRAAIGVCISHLGGSTLTPLPGRCAGVLCKDPRRAGKYYLNIFIIARRTGPKTNTDNVVINPTITEILIISGNRAQPPLGSINIPTVDGAKNVIPINTAINTCDNLLSITTKRTISHKPIAKVAIGVNKNAPHCSIINNS